MPGHLFIFSGASGSGKTSVLNHVCFSSGRMLDLAPKYSERESRGGNDDIKHVASIEETECDIAYVINNRRYGIDSQEIKQLLDSNKNYGIVLSDLRVVRRLRRRLGTRCHTVYVSRGIDENELMRVHGQRHAFKPTDVQKSRLRTQFARLSSAARLEMWPRLFECISELQEDWRAFIPESDSVLVRSQKIRTHHSRYVDNIEMFDHVILNYSDEGEIWQQAQNLIRSVIGGEGGRRFPRSPALFVVAAASGSGKGMLMQTLRAIGQNQIAIVSKMGMRPPKDNDGRDGMTPLGYNGIFPEDFDFRWRFHKGKDHPGIEYAVSTDEISRNIDAGRMQIVISNMHQFGEFRRRFGEHPVFLYLHRVWSAEEDLRRFQMKVNTPDEAERRIAGVSATHGDYIERISDFDHVLLNTSFPEDLYDQMFRLLEVYDTTNSTVG